MLISLFSFLAGLILFIPVRTLALKLKITDVPDGVLKKHGEPQPYFGGVLVFLAFICGLLIEWYLVRYAVMPIYKGLLVCSLLILFIGLVDDIYRIGWGVKLAGQIIVAIVLLSYGTGIEFMFLPEWANKALTVLWLLFTMNAFNIADVSDGVSSSVFLVFLASSYYVAFITSDTEIMYLILPLFGAVLSFWVFNMPKAKIFAGDSGSLFFGFMAGYIAIGLRYTAFNKFALPAPLLFHFYLICEMGLVVISRISAGISPFRGSPHHIPVRMKKAGVQDIRIVAFVLLISSAASVAGAAMLTMKGLAPLAVSAIGAAGVFLTISVFRKIGR